MTTSSGGTVYFHYNGDKVIYETDANNNIVAEYTWDAQGRPVTMTKNGATYYYHLNGHGDITKLTDASGSVVAEYLYDAWGNILSQTGTMAAANPYRYAGYRFDESTGLYYLMARYYDAGVGRFLTRDVVPWYPDHPQKFNLYEYALNNPVMFIDPTGYSSYSLYDQWTNLTSKEKWLVVTMPWQAYYVNKARNLAWSETQRRFGYNGRNDRSDAFRHAYWNSLMTKYIGAYWAEKWATAHEYGRAATDPAGTSMDLHNNAVGRDIGRYNSWASETELSRLVMDALNRGRLRTLA